MADIITRLTGDNSQFRAMIDNSTAYVSKFGGVLSALGVGISAGGVIAFLKAIVEQGGKLQDLSDRLGVGTTELQAFDYTVRQAGGTTEQANLTWDKARKALDNLKAGTPGVVTQFEALRLSSQDFIGLNLPQSLALIAQAYENNKYSAGAYDAVTDILGSKSAPALMAALKELASGGFDELNKSVREAGQIIEQDAIARFDSLGDRIEKHKGQLTAAGATALNFGLKFGETLTIANEAAKQFFFGTEQVPAKIGSAAKTAMEELDKIVIPIQHLTKEEEKQVKAGMEKIRLSREHLESSERMKLLLEEQMNIERALEQVGVSTSVSEALRLSLAENQKQIAIENKALSSEEEKHAQRMEEFTKKEFEDNAAKLTAKQEMALLQEQEAGWAAVLADASLTAEQRRNAEIEQAKVRQEMRGLEKEVQAEQLELAKLMLIPESERSAIEKLRIEVLQGIVTQKQLDEELTRLTAGAVAGILTPAEKERLNVLLGQEAVLERQLETAKAIVTTVNRTGKGYDQQSDQSLEGVRDRLKKQIDQIKRDDFGVPGGVGGKGKPAELYLLESELFNLEKEIGERKKVSDYANLYGEDKTRQKFGDTLTDKALRDLTDTSVRSTNAIEDIQKRLALIFPDKK